MYRGKLSEAIYCSCLQIKTETASIFDKMLNKNLSFKQDTKYIDA